jgi:probable phosphoglycerate mutase
MSPRSSPASNRSARRVTCSGAPNRHRCARRRTSTSPTGNGKTDLLINSLVVVRHAQSQHHVDRLTGGWTDSPLTELGHEQSRRLAARLKAELGDTPVALYTSDLTRATQTAAHVASAFGFEPIQDERLREHNNGENANMTLDDAFVRYADVYDHPWTIDERPFPGSETGREFYARVSAFIDTLSDDGRTPIVVTHGGTAICLIARWLMLTPEAFEPVGFSTHTTGVTVLVRDRFGRPVVERINDISHLAGIEGWVPLTTALERT